MFQKPSFKYKMAMFYSKELLLGLQDLQGTPHRINGLGVVLKKSKTNPAEYLTSIGL